MPEQKTKPTAQTVESFLGNIADEQTRDDCTTLTKIMQKATGSGPTMWGTSIVGFGQYHYTYESGHEGYACLTGFSPRKTALTLYVMPGSAEHDSLLEKLGKFKMGKGCLYVKKLADVDLVVLQELVTKSVEVLKKKYPTRK